MTENQHTKQHGTTITEGDNDPRHGTPNGYVNLHCRCVECKAANATTMRQRRALRALTQIAPTDPRHGNVNTYANHGCRCKECKAASAAYANIRYHRKRKAVG